MKTHVKNTHVNDIEKETRVPQLHKCPRSKDNGMVKTAIIIKIFFLVQGVSNKNKDRFESNVHFMVFMSKVRKWSKFENRNSGPA